MTNLSEHIETTLRKAAAPMTAGELANSAIRHGLIPKEQQGRAASVAISTAMKPMKAEGVILQRTPPRGGSPEYWWHTHNPDAATAAETETVEDYSQEEAACREILAAEDARIEAEEATDDTDTSDLTELCYTILREAYAEPKPDDLALILEDPFNGTFLENAPHPVQAYRWHRICKSLAHNPRIKDPIANELFNLSDFLRTLTGEAA